MLAVLTLGIGLAGGMFVLALIKCRSLHKAYQACRPVCLPIVILGVALYLIIENWGTFTNPPLVNSWAKFQTILFNNKASETVVLFSIFFALLGVLSYIIRVPFADWSQIKLFGLFEATRIREQAKDEFKVV